MLTDNQKKALSVLTDKYEKLSPIVRRYAKKRSAREQYTSHLTSCQGALNGLLKKGLVEYKYRGMWKLKKLNG